MGVHGEAEIFGELLYCYFLRIVVNGNDNTAYILEHSDSPAKSIERTAIQRCHRTCGYSK